MKHMTNVLSLINGLFTTAIRSLYPGHAHSLKGVIQFSGSGSRFGDYKCIAAMPLSKVTMNHVMEFSQHITYFLSVIEGSGSEYCP